MAERGLFVVRASARPTWPRRAEARTTSHRLLPGGQANVGAGRACRERQRIGTRPPHNRRGGALYPPARAPQGPHGDIAAAAARGPVRSPAPTTVHAHCGDCPVQVWTMRMAGRQVDTAGRAGWQPGEEGPAPAGATLAYAVARESSYLFGRGVGTRLCRSAGAGRGGVPPSRRGKGDRGLGLVLELVPKGEWAGHWPDRTGGVPRV